MKWYVKDSQEVYDMLLNLARKTPAPYKNGYQPEVFYFKDEKQYGMWADFLYEEPGRYEQVSVDVAIERINQMIVGDEPQLWLTRTPTKAMSDLLCSLVPELAENDNEEVFYRHYSYVRNRDTWGTFALTLIGQEYEEISYEQALKYLTNGRSILECVKQ